MKNIDDFTCIYCDCFNEFQIFECNNCHAIILIDNNSMCSYYEPNMTCPCCTDYKTQYKYYTAQEVMSDFVLQTGLNTLKASHQHDIEMDKRIKKRNGLYDWELWKKTFTFKKHKYKITILIDDITKSKFKGFNICIDKYKIILTNDITMSEWVSCKYLRKIYK